MKRSERQSHAAVVKVGYSYRYKPEPPSRREVSIPEGGTDAAGIRNLTTSLRDGMAEAGLE
ncbi:MAG: hypothetical protein HPY85_16945 [Anaerolineae bacterium]|nr:hypothetical protein [Anaerolineae bacterium]